MTEQENNIIDDLHLLKTHYGEEENYVIAKQIIDEAIKELEEIQRYRAIGTVDALNQLKENGAFAGIELAQIAIGQMRLKEYQKIGTPDECRAAVEQLKAAKEDIRKLLHEEYGSSCQFCIQNDNEDAMCSKACGSGSWCCENAAWKSHRLE